MRMGDCELSTYIDIGLIVITRIRPHAIIFDFNAKILYMNVRGLRLYKMTTRR